MLEQIQSGTFGHPTNRVKALKGMIITLEKFLRNDRNYCAVFE